MNTVSSLIKLEKEIFNLRYMLSIRRLGEGELIYINYVYAF